MEWQIIIFVLLVVLLAVRLIWSSSQRGAGEVAQDLMLDAESSSVAEDPERLLRKEKITLGDDLARAGLLTAAERERFVRIGRWYPFIGVVVGALIKTVSIAGQQHLFIPAILVGFAAGVLVQQGRIRRRREIYIKKIEFFLPIVMERLVMAVQSGLDISAAIGAIVDLDGESSEGATIPEDPVTPLLKLVRRLSEQGLGFQQALNLVADAIDCNALKHAFIHLAVAYEEGGEVVMPLKELSDSTQLYYQETVDEHIARLPVKATMPLLCTFAGLIMCFITMPLIQVMGIAKNTTEEISVEHR